MHVEEPESRAAVKRLQRTESVQPGRQSHHT